MGTLVVGGHEFTVTGVELRGAAFTVRAVDRSRRAYTLRADDAYTLFGVDGRGICQGSFGVVSRGLDGLRKTRADTLTITVKLQINTVTQGPRAMTDHR